MGGTLRLNEGMFQSTPLREGRRFFVLALLDEIRFNPRPCVRGDLCTHEFIFTY